MRNLLPGLWDVHIHPDYLSVEAMPLADQVTLFGHRLAAALTESGIVGMRCAGTHSFMDVAWKRAFDSGQHLGPRLFACGHFHRSGQFSTAISAGSTGTETPAGIRSNGTGARFSHINRLTSFSHIR